MPERVLDQDGPSLVEHVLQPLQSSGGRRAGLGGVDGDPQSRLSVRVAPTCSGPRRPIAHTPSAAAATRTPAVETAVQVKW